MGARGDGYDRDQDGERVAVAMGGRGEVWSCEDGAVQSEMHVGGSVSCLPQGSGLGFKGEKSTFVSEKCDTGDTRGRGSWAMDFRPRAWRDPLCPLPVAALG